MGTLALEIAGLESSFHRDIACKPDLLPEASKKTRDSSEIRRWEQMEAVLSGGNFAWMKWIG